MTLVTLQIHHSLIAIIVCINDSTIEALIDSSASHNFVSKSVVLHILWLTSTMDWLVELMADRLKAFSMVIYIVLFLIGVLIYIDTLYVLDISLDMVLGMPWLCKVNPHIDCTE